ncbi:hypothetical protein MUG91_G83n56 [Manis pentadactyla]|nr:hypothetical protein MUG91_G83n56 [Manis pentadactyla]
MDLLSRKQDSAQDGSPRKCWRYLSSKATQNLPGARNEERNQSHDGGLKSSSPVIPRIGVLASTEGKAEIPGMAES